MKKGMEKRQEEIVKNDGPWTAHNIQLSENDYTIDKGIIGDEYKLRRIIQNINDFTTKPFGELRILDLACLEGLFGIECARQGASTMLLDAREANLRKVEFVKDYLELKNIELVKDDVRKISKEKYGEFDVILCLGIFYHLDHKDLHDFISRMYDMTTGIVIFDTHISLTKKTSFQDMEENYFGRRYLEHRSDSTEEDRERDVWKSYDNNYSFVLTRKSLMRMLHNVGFSSVSETMLPHEPGKPTNRVTFTAYKGQKITLLNCPSINDKANENIKEDNLSDKAKEKYIIARNTIVYNLKIKSPKWLRDFYKKKLKKK